MAGRTLDWANVLDLARGASNCHYDLYGEWYRDPWAWPEIRWLAEKRGVHVVRTSVVITAHRVAAGITLQ